MKSLSQNSSWHLDKKVPIGIIFAVLSVFMVNQTQSVELRKDVEFLKMQTAEQHLRDDAQDKANADARSLLRASLSRIEENQYRIMELMAQEARNRKQ